MSGGIGVTGKTIRLSKLFPNGNNAVVVAIDHGQTFGPIACGSQADCV